MIEVPVCRCREDGAPAEPETNPTVRQCRDEQGFCPDCGRIKRETLEKKEG